MWPNPQFPADLVSFTEKTLNGKLFFCAVGMMSLNYQIDQILYQIFRIPSIYVKKQKIHIYVKKKTENRIMSKLKTGYYLELLITETMKLLESTKNKVTKDENVVLIHRNIVNNNHPEDLRVLYTFIANKLSGQVLDISPKNFIFLKYLNSVISYLEVWFTDPNSKLLEIN